MSDEKYISSKQAAKMTGYSSDYVGQLCRLGKVRSKRIGRDWMISERSILNYKNEGNQLKNIKNNLSARFGEIYKFYALARQIFSIRKSRLDEWDKALFENKRPKYNFDLGYLIRPLAFTAIFMAVITGFILNLGFISKLAYQVKNDVAQIDLPSLPSFSLPEIPEIAFPKLAMPKITLPKISIPKIALPEISLPEIALPEFSLPKFSLTLPQFNLPNIENLLGLIKIPTSPKLSWPNFSLPKISFPNISLARLDLARLAALPSLPFTWEDSRLAVLDLKNRFLDNLFSWKDYLASLGGDIKIIAQDFLSIKPSSTLGVESPKTPSVFPGEGSKIITFASSTPLSSSLPLTKGEGQVGGGGVKEIRTVVERVLSGVSQSELDQKLSQFNQIILSQIQLSLSALEKRLPSNQVQNPVMFLTTSIPGPYASSPPQTGSGVSASFGDFSSGISTGGNLTASGNIILGQDNKTVEITSSTWKITSGGAASGFTSLSTNSLSSGNLTVNGTETLSGNLTLSSNLIFSNQSTTTIPSSLMNALTFATSSASVPFFTFDTKNYRIGIGTTSPSATFSVSGDILASGGLNVSGASMNVNSTTTLTEQLLVTKSPTVAHSFGTWSVGVANSAVTDAVVVINPASATADTNLFGAAVGGAVKFLIDADGDVFANGLTTVGGTTLASTTASTFTVENQFIMGDAPNSDSHIFKGRVTHFATTTGAAYTIWNSTVSGDLLRLQTGATDPTTSFVFSAAGQAAFGTTTVSGLSVLTIGATTTSSIPLTLKGFTGQAANLFQILDSGNAQLLTVSSGGSVGIGTTTPSNLFSVHGNGLFSGNLSLANLTATGTLSVTGIPTFSALGTDLLTAINSSGALVSTSTPTAARYFATSSIASIFPYASTTAITSSGTASTTNLTVSSLLSGRVPYITTAGLLADSSGLTWNNGASRLTAIYASTTAISGTNIDFGTLTLTNALAIASGGTNASSFTTSGNAVYYNGTSLLTAPLGSAITIPYATTTGISSSQGATFATVSGNVGIGTTSPASLLSVAGAGYFTGNVGIGTANPVFTKLLATSVAGKSDRDGRGDAAQFYGATDINKGTIAVFDSSTAETVGIGGRIFLGSYNTSGDFSSFGSIGIARENAISGNYASSLTFRTTINGANEAETMRITSAGNVGIGTTTPGALLDLTKTSSGATADMLFLSNDASATSTASRLSFRTKDLVNATSTGAITGLLTQNFNGGKGDLAFSTLRSGLLTEAMRITDAGNVGIGTTSPISLLSVQGNCVTGDTRLRRRRRKKKKNGEYEYEEDE
ncbi:MAG: hypothetical protein Q8R12_01160, partial [bacterium]|nr:hypothetical protein [bacterium]